MVRQSSYEKEKMGKPIRVRLPEELITQLEALPNKSEFIREAVSRALERRYDLEEIGAVKEELRRLREEIQPLGFGGGRDLEEIAILREEIAHLRREIQGLKQAVELRLQGTAVPVEEVKADPEDEARIFTALESLLGLGKKGGIMY
ncbi:MAG: hypothetical protein QXI12_09040 [Candidatus Methanomethyliaceae archaeon]